MRPTRREIRRCPRCRMEPHYGADEQWPWTCGCSIRSEEECRALYASPVWQVSIQLGDVQVTAASQVSESAAVEVAYRLAGRVMEE